MNGLDTEYATNDRLDEATGCTGFHDSEQVYYNDNEFFVTSRTVRIGDESWNLEDIEYISHESHEGWLGSFGVYTAVFAIVFFIAVWLASSSRYFTSGFLFYIVFSYVAFRLAFYLLGRLIKKANDITGINRLYVHTRDSEVRVKSFSEYSRYYWTIRTFCDAVSLAVQDRISTIMPVPGHIRTPVNTQPWVLSRLNNVYVTVNDEKARLFNMVWDTDSIKSVSYDSNFSKSFNSTFLAFLFVTSCFTWLIFRYCGDPSLIFFYYGMSLFTIFSNRPSNYTLDIGFEDGSKKTIRRWSNGDDSNFSLAYFNHLLSEKIAKRDGTAESAHLYMADDRFLPRRSK